MLHFHAWPWGGGGVAVAAVRFEKQDDKRHVQKGGGNHDLDNDLVGLATETMYDGYIIHY